MDIIRIEKLEIFANHGVFPEENRLGQKFELSLELHTETRMAGLNDDLEYSVHYGLVSEFAVEYLQKQTFKLIEAASEHLAEAILLEFPQIMAVRVQLYKPWAPIGLPLEAVSVDIFRKWHVVYLSIGSNMGDREKYLKKSIKALNKNKRCHVTKVSKFIETEPYGNTNQDKFLNGCLEIQTLLSPYELLDTLHDIEAEAGRERKEHWGPRTLDMDILLYDSEIVQDQDLVIPHLDMTNRLFVLEPLSEIAPYIEHPVEHRNIMQLKKKLEKKAK